MLGFAAFALIPKGKQSKVDAKCMKLMFISNSEQPEVYRLIDMVNNKGIFKCDIIINGNAELFQSNSD